MIDSWIIRSSYIGKKIKSIIEDSNLTISEIAKKIWSSQPTLSNVLKWKWWSDEYFTKVWKALWLSDKKITAIFKEADKEEFKYKYWEDIKNDNVLEDINFDVALKKEFWKEMDQDTISKIKDFINFVNQKK